MGEKQQVRTGAGGRPRAPQAERAAQARSAVVRSAFARPQSGTTATRVVWAPPAFADDAVTFAAPSETSAPPVIDITPGLAETAVSGRRRLRAGPVAAAAVAALVAGGVAYAARAPADTSAPRVTLPSVAAPVIPTAGAPGVQAPRVRNGAAVPASSRASSAPHPSSKPPADANPRPPQQPPSVPVTTMPTRPARTAMTVIVSYDPASGTGSVRLVNPGESPVKGWRVGLDFPDGGPVTSDDATVRQDGRHVELSGGGPVPAGGTRTVHYAGSGPPRGCAINGDPCA